MTFVVPRFNVKVEVLIDAGSISTLKVVESVVFSAMLVAWFTGLVPVTFGRTEGSSLLSQPASINRSMLSTGSTRVIVNKFFSFIWLVVTCGQGMFPQACAKVTYCRLPTITPATSIFTDITGDVRRLFFI